MSSVRIVRRNTELGRGRRRGDVMGVLDWVGGDRHRNTRVPGLTGGSEKKKGWAYGVGAWVLTSSLNYSGRVSCGVCVSRVTPRAVGGDRGTVGPQINCPTSG